MVVGEGEMKQGGVEAPLPSEEAPKNQAPSSLGRQSSIYSLTLDEFQHTLCEGGKNFGSMNMDEFLSSIWSAEESQAINSSSNQHNTTTNSNSHLSFNDAGASDKGIRKQPSLPRQGSLTIPPPLSGKTVDEVWSEIHKAHHDHNDGAGNDGDVQNADSAPRQPTFGEMTLEDFLIKAGVVRESCPMPAPAPPQQYGMYPNNKSPMGPTFVGRPLMGNVVPPYQGEPSGYAGNGKRDTGYPPPPPPPSPGVCHGGGGYGAAPVSPVSSDGIGASENAGGQYGMEMGVLRGRKRIIDGPVEKVVERRQRRMIKNRESAARSRARKQAYTVELEAELNQLRKENAQLKLALAELERRRNQQCFENNSRVQTKAQKAKEKLRALRRNLSCPL